MTDSLRFFPTDYRSSRQRFRQLVAESGIFSALSPILVPDSEENDLTVDLAWSAAKRRPEHLLVISSGVHGPETYTGAAIQLAWLSELVNRLPVFTPFLDRSSVLLIHSLNPFGYLHHRRGTAANVNLNRNFAFDPAIYQMSNPVYDQVWNAIQRPGRLGHPVVERARLLVNLTRVLVGHRLGVQALNQGLFQGQFHHPEGLEFGGRGPEPQVSAVCSALRELISQHERVTLVDLHTGLGERGVLHLIPQPRLSGSAQRFHEAVWQSQLDQDVYTITEMTEPGFYTTYGDFTDWFNRTAEGLGRPALSVTAEFGTLGSSPAMRFESMARLFIENQGFHQGFQSDQAQERALFDFMEMFFPVDPRWRKEVLQRGISLLTRFALRLGGFLDSNTGARSQANS